jgi:glucose/mannose transport system permease protein
MWNIPENIRGGGFAEAARKLWPNMQNSLLMVIPATIISSFLGALNGYLLSKWKFPGADVLFTIMLFGFFIPYQAVLLPLVRFLQVVHLYGTIPGLVLCHVIYGLPITTLMFRTYFAGVPTELIEAASGWSRAVNNLLESQTSPVWTGFYRRGDLPIHEHLERCPVWRHSGP